MNVQHHPTYTNTAFSNGVHHALLSLSSKFRDNIHDAYNSDPSMKPDDPFEGTTARAMREIQANKKAIDSDMHILHRAQLQGKVAVNDYKGFRELGRNTYLDLMDDLFDSDDEGEDPTTPDYGQYSCATYSDEEEEAVAIVTIGDESDSDDEEDDESSYDDESSDDDDDSEYDSDSDSESDWDSDFDDEFDAGFDDMMAAMASHGFVDLNTNTSMTPAPPSPNVMSSRALPKQQPRTHLVQPRAPLSF